MQIGDLMSMSGVAFGTSGARGLAQAMTDRVCYAYTVGFLGYLRASGLLAADAEVGLGGDLRPSTSRILVACARAALDLGCRPRYLGRIPSPAVAAWGLARGAPSLMVTGSHIPDDRNGIKFNLPTGEILKRDEEGIRGQPLQVPEKLFDAAGAFVEDQSAALPKEDPLAYRDYLDRYLDFFPSGCLDGLHVGVYQHSSVARERLAEIHRGDPARDKAAAQAVFGAAFGPVADLDVTDGLRITFASGEIAHLRPSGNAPELRAYTEADSPERAEEMNRICMEILARWRA